MFSDVNRGNPSSDSCFVAVKDFFKTNGATVSYVFYAVGGLLGLLVVVAFCMCFHPNLKKRNTHSYYQRMGEFE